MPEPDPNDRYNRILDRASSKAGWIAAERYAAVCYVEGLCQAGSTLTAAAASAGVKFGVHHRTIWTWIAKVRGYKRTPTAWMCALLPAQRRNRNSEIIPLWETENA